MQARYYDPVIGRFYSNDPVGYTSANPVMSFNRYLYVNNNPYKYTDPNGEFLNFAVKFVADVAVGAALNYVTTGSVNLSGAIKESALGVLNPAKSVQKIKKLAQAIKKSDTLKPGKFANGSIPARGPERNFTKSERAEINKMGSESGCHTCGSADAGTKSGNFIPDHQPPNALNTSNNPQKLMPHCKSCSAKQAGEVTQAKRKMNQE
jgi:uncharacterized protein RhaS with RHS repeats